MKTGLRSRAGPRLWSLHGVSAPSIEAKLAVSSALSLIVRPTKVALEEGAACNRRLAEARTFLSDLLVVTKARMFSARLSVSRSQCWRHSGGYRQPATRQ